MGLSGYPTVESIDASAVVPAATGESRFPTTD